MNDLRRTRAGTGNRIALGVLILLVSLFVFICICGGFGGVGEMVSDVLLGFFGLADYAYTLALIVAAVAVIFNFRVRMAPSKIVKLAVLVLMGIWALHIYSSSAYLPDNGYGDYLVACYRGTNTAGGMLLGIISFPLMRAITTVGALIVVCAAFFVLVIVFLIPTIKRDVTYTSYTPAPKEPKPERRKGSRMDRQREPSITDFNGGADGGGSLYVVEVEGDPMSSRNKRRSGKGAEGYDPLYPNSAAQMEDDMRFSDESHSDSADRFSSRRLARDILMGPEPSDETYSRFRTMTNPDDALRNPSATFGPVRRQELRRRLGVDEVTSARDFARARYGDADTTHPTDAPSGGEEKPFVRDPNARGAAALGYSSFDALKSDRLRTFGEMSATGDPVHNSPTLPAAPASGGGTAPLSSGTGMRGEPARREVPASPRAAQRQSAPAIPSAPATTAPQSASNMAGLHGSVARAISGEDKAAPPEGKALPEASAYNSVSAPPASKAAAFEAAVRSASEVTRKNPTDGRAADVFRSASAPSPAKPAPAPSAPAGAASASAPSGPASGTVAGRPAAGSESPKSDGAVIQQSMFARQQFAAIARARGEDSDQLKQLEAEKRKRAATAKERVEKRSSAVKTENPEGARGAQQVHIEQEISKATPKKPYVAPPISLLAPPEPAVSQNEDYEAKKKQLCDTLAFFDIQSEVTDIQVGPTFSLYTLKVEMPRGAKVSNITTLDSDIAMRMEEESVRIIAPIPGKNAVGIEVPNKYRRMVRLSEILQSPAFNNAASPTTFALGVDLYGKSYVCDVASLPHMLVAGATGAGKSCCINSLIISLLYKASPEDLRMILIDPKRVEFSAYAGIPHLMLDEIVCDVDKAIRALNWAIAEMERRIAYLSSLKYSDIADYNRDCEKLGYPKMPRIVIIVDELADLMAQGKKAVEEAINRLARLARAMGIHLILATQRPSVDVISGTIKNNLPTRIAFRVTAGPDSRTVLDAGGAEKLLGNGDLLYLNPKFTSNIRMQGSYISPPEIRSVVEFVTSHNESVYDSSVKDAIFKEPVDPEEEKRAEKGSGGRKSAGGMPPEVFDAVRMGLDGTPITISSMQRKLSLGFPKAAKIFDIMKDMGLIEYDAETKKHRVCISEEELDALENGGGEEDGGEE